MGYKTPSDDLQETRECFIIEARRQEFGFEEIGEVLGITRQWAQEIAKEIMAKKGENIFQAEDPLLTIDEVAKRLAVPASRIRQMCHDQCIAHVVRRAGKYHKLFILKSHVEELKNHPRILEVRERQCVVCNKRIVRRHAKRRLHATCSKKCSQENTRRQYERGCKRKPSSKSLTGWRKILWEKLRRHEIPEDETWLTFGQAVEYTGLSKMQVEWLRMKRVVKIRPLTKRKRRGKWVRVYPQSQLRIARQVFRQYQKRKAKGAGSKRKKIAA